MSGRKPDPGPSFAPPQQKPTTRAELAARLKALSESEPPTDLKMGAMCYEVAACHDTEDYHCPTCGARTTYPRGSLEAIREARALVPRIKAAVVVLDESYYCERCRGASKRLGLTLRVHHPGEAQPHLVGNITSDDLQLLKEFFEGQGKHVAGDDESPLKDHLERLQQLLGVKAGT